MFKLSCMDIDPALGCHFEGRGETADEVAIKMLEHVKKAHPEKMKGMMDNEMLEKFQSIAHE